MPDKTIRIWFQNKRCKSPTGRNKSRIAKQNKKMSLNIENNSSNSEAEEEQEVEFKCRICEQSFSTKWNLKTHLQRFHGDKKHGKPKTVSCNQCERMFPNNLALKLHIGRRHTMAHQILGRKKGGGKLGKEQKQKLLQQFGMTNKPKDGDLIKMAKEMRVTVKQITGWLKKHQKKENIKQTSVSEKSSSMSNGGPEAEEDYKNKDDKYENSTNSEKSTILKRLCKERVEVMSVDEDEVDEVSPKLPYNPGHKKTKFSEFQRNHLRQFFQVTFHVT